MKVVSVLKVPSLFASEVRGHVKHMEHHVVAYEEIVEKRSIERKEKQRKGDGDGTEAESSTMQKRDDPKEYREQKRKVTTPISIEDLFKPRSLKAGVGKSDIRKVLLYGNPGSGKTCLSKAIAYRWALGKTLQEFKAIYVVPVRRLNVAKAKGARGEGLTEVIAHMCFEQKESDTEFEDLKTQVNDDFDMSSTLLVFDGLDEADDDTRELLSKVEKDECRLLILTRPYNLQGIRTRVDFEFECLGFNDQQLRNYINKELQQDGASRLIHSLQENRGMWEAAHTPVTAYILCTLSKERGTSIENRGKRTSMFQIYVDMTDFVWKRFKEKADARTADKSVVFEDLEKIAFEALKKGQILIEESIVEHYTTSTNTTEIFRKSGFLLLVLEGKQYQFPHLTFQEYFAGEYIARNLIQKGSEEETKVLDFIQEEKYNEKHALTLSFAMHAFARKRSKHELKEMLSIVDQQPVEVLGIQHFFLRMRVLEAILEEAEAADLKTLERDEQAIEIAESARRLLKGTIDNILVCEIVVEAFDKCFRVLEHFPIILNDAIDGTKTLLASSRYLTWNERARVDAMLKLARHSPKHIGDIGSFLRLNAKVKDRQRNTIGSFLQRNTIGSFLQRNTIGSFLQRNTIGSFLQRNTIGSFLQRNTIGSFLQRNTIGSFLQRNTIGSFLQRNTIGSFLQRNTIGSFLQRNTIGSFLQRNTIGSFLQRNTIGSFLQRNTIGSFLQRNTIGSFLQRNTIGSFLQRNTKIKERHSKEDGTARLLDVVRKIPQIADSLLPMLQDMCTEEDSNVRSSAMEAIGSIAKAAPHISSDLLPMLQEGFTDEDSNVRMSAMEAIGSIAKAAAHISSDLLPMIQEGFTDEATNVRMSAMEAIGSIAESAPHISGHLLTMLQKGYDENASDVRVSAMFAICRIAKAAPQIADSLLPMLQKECINGDFNVRISAMEAVGSIAMAAPQLASYLLPELQKGCDDPDFDVRMSTMSAIGRIAMAAPQLASNLLPELQKGCDDPDFHVRRRAMLAIRRIVKAAPQLAGNVLPNLPKGCSDKVFDVRWRAMQAIGSIAEAAPHFGGYLIAMLQKGCSDKASVVRKSAMPAISDVAKAAPQLAVGLLSMLQKGCIDKASVVRENAILAIGDIALAAPQLVADVLPVLQKGCINDPASVVRKNAILAVGSIAEVAPHLGGYLLAVLQEGCDDKDFGVRQRAMSAIRHIVESGPHLAGVVLPVFQKGCSDEDVRVRENAMEAISSIAEAAPHLAGDVLLVLQKGCNDEDFGVHSAAKKTLNSINVDKFVFSTIFFTPTYEECFLLLLMKNAFTLDSPFGYEKVSLILHTTSSKQIGRWNKKNLDGFLWRLRKQADERFSGLSSYLRTKY